MPRQPKRKEPAQPTPSNGNGVQALIKELWQAAVNLRGSIEPADYKRYVLPIIFLRFLSLRYERRRAELEKLIATPGSEFHTTDAKSAARILKDEDEYKAVGALLVPEEARWDTIVQQARADDIKVRLDKILERLEDRFPKLRGLLGRPFGGSNLDAENVRGLITLFSKDVFKEH
ncbi:MAG TPA: type I restriction-modification system subunit M N-terminal domain-containing protein, partial [Gemmataceae bacterium]|nr:type I restriction-modification system subunit M N-terminal domain-containing protein [Gemmataceae bacterium]